MEKNTIDTTIDNAKFNRFHLRVLLLCTLIIIFDGYDLVIYGVVLPSLMEQWQLSPIEAGALGSYALFGMMIGAILFGQLADKIGRRHSIAICIALFSGMTFLNGFATNATEFGICRFLAGLGIGGVMPNVVALMNEVSPKKFKGTLVAIMFSGYSIGGIGSGYLGMHIIPQYGWQPLFFIAALPLLLLPVVYLLLPESVAFLVQKGKKDMAIKVLSKLIPTTKIEDVKQLVTNAITSNSSHKAPSGNVGELFKPSHVTATILLWTAFFCCLLMVYALTSWLPKLMNNAGFSLGSSLKFLIILNVGAIIGAIAGGWFGDRYNLPKVLVIFFLASAVSITALGYDIPTSMRYLSVAVAGAATIGSQILLYALSAQYYPTNIRSTGLGWCSGIGRNGAIVGPLLGGVILSASLGLQANFIIFAIPGLISMFAMWMFYLKTKPDSLINIDYADSQGSLK